MHIVIEANDFRPLEPDTLYESLKKKKNVLGRCLKSVYELNEIHNCSLWMSGWLR